VSVLCIGTVVDEKKSRLGVAQAKCKQVQNPCRWARRAEDGENEGADARNPDLALGGEAGRSAAAAQMFYASSLLSEC